MKAISSEANSAFRRWLRVATMPRAARAFGQTLAEGIHLAQAAIDSAIAVDAVLVRRGTRHPQIEALLERLPSSATRYELAPALYDRLAPVEQGVGLLLVLPVPECALPQRAAIDMLYLDGVQDPGNVGALIRTAAAAGVGRVLAATGTAWLWSPKALRAGMGAHFRIGLHERVAATQLPSTLDGQWIVALAHDAPSLWEQDLPRCALGWIFGAEGTGPSSAALAASHTRVRIPMAGGVESLNVAAAAAVCLFERLRRKQALDL